MAGFFVVFLRAGDFRAGDLRAGDFLVAVFFAAVFLLGAGFFAAGFLLVAGFLAAGFLFVAVATRTGDRAPVDLGATRLAPGDILELRGDTIRKRRVVGLLILQVDQNFLKDFRKRVFIYKKRKFISRLKGLLV